MTDNSPAAILERSAFYVLTNNKHTKVIITNYGARIVSFKVLDNDGNAVEINIGFDNIGDYIKSTSRYYGATIGRYANRIANAKFSIDGVEYHLPANNGPNNLHGGDGFQEAVWTAEQLNDNSITLSYLSHDGEQGFPGDVEVRIRYTLTDDNELKMDYEAVTDKPTVVNLTNHAFFNLNGVGSGSITGHTLQINAASFTPVNDVQIPTGEIALVEGTPFDFREPHIIGDRIESGHEQLLLGKGYDHNFVLNGMPGEMRHAATATGDKTGIKLDIFTTEPGLQFYTGNFMDGTNVIADGFTDDYRTAFALETQHFPNSPNQPAFPSTTLLPGQAYKTSTVYKVSLV